MNDEIATKSLRLFKKVLILADDLITNDDNIIGENPFFVREYFARSELILGQLLKCVSYAKYVGNLEDLKMIDIRSQTLRILFRIH